MSLDELADALLELRRYVRTKPEHVVEQIRELHMAIFRLDCTPLFGHRLRDNIGVGVSRIHCDPEMLRGYLYGAAQEIREHAEGNERSGSNEVR